MLSIEDPFIVFDESASVWRVLLARRYSFGELVFESICHCEVRGVSERWHPRAEEVQRDGIASNQLLVRVLPG